MKMERKLAVITGADGGMGTEITRAVALAGYRVVMACCNLEKAKMKKNQLIRIRGIGTLKWNLSTWLRWLLWPLLRKRFALVERN